MRPCRTGRPIFIYTYIHTLLTFPRGFSKTIIHIYVMRIPHAVRIENVTACFAFVFTKSHFAQAINYVVSAA